VLVRQRETCWRSCLQFARFIAGAPGGGGGAGAARGQREAKVLAWDAKAMRFTNDDTANTLVDTPYRKEWDYQV